jgi:hypothetical protein
LLCPSRKRNRRWKSHVATRLAFDEIGGHLHVLSSILDCTPRM